MLRKTIKLISGYFCIIYMISIAYSGKIIVWNVNAQALDNGNITVLLKQAANTEDSLKVLEKFAAQPPSVSPDSLLSLAKMRVSLAQKINEPHRIAEAYAFLAEMFAKLNRSDSAAGYTLKSYAIARDAKDTLLMFRQVQALGGYLMRQHKNKEAIALLNAFLKAYGNRIPPHLKALMYGNLGASYEQEENYIQAVENYLKSLEYAEQSKDYRALTIAYYNLGYLYILLQQYDKAIDYLTKGLKIARQHGVGDYEGHLYERLAAAYEGKEDLSRAAEYMKKAILIYQKQGNLPFLTLAKRNLAAIYVNLEKYEEAIPLAKEAVKLGEQIGMDAIKKGAEQILALAYLYANRLDKAKPLLDKTIGQTNPEELDPYARIDYYNVWYEYYYRKGDYAKALENYRQMVAIEDSIQTADIKKQIREIEEKYQNAKKQQEISRLKQEKAEKDLAYQKERQQKLLLSGGLTATFFILMLTALFYYRTHRQKKIIENLQRELHHRIKNNLSIIVSLVEELQYKYKDKPHIHDDLEDLKTRIANIYHIHKQLYSGKDVKHLPFKIYLDKLSSLIRENYNRPEIEIINKTAPGIHLKADKSLLLGLIVNEFILNSFKHAFPGKKQGKILLDFKETPDEWILEMSDDGIGLPPDLDLHKIRSFGLDVMQILSKQLNGKFKLENNNGVKVVIRIPKT